MSAYGSGTFVNGINIAEANAKIPRNVQFDWSSMKPLIGALLWFLIMIVAAAWISYSTIRDVHVQNMLRREGRMADGVITKEVVSKGDLFVSYRFSIGDESYSGKYRMVSRVPRSGGQIPILYLPGNPKINQPRDWEWFTAWDIVPDAVLLFIALIPVYLFGFVLRERHLARVGVVVEGRVAGCEPKGSLFTVYYDFRTEDNSLIEGSSITGDEYEPGNPFPVIYLRSNPNRNDRYPQGDFRVED